MKKQLLTAAMAGLLSASTIMSAFAAQGGAVPTPSGTDVYAGVALHDPDAKVNVLVPTLFGFVVMGTIDTTNVTPLTAADIKKPNVKVNVDTSSTPNSLGGYNYSIDVEQNYSFVIENRSTKAIAGAAAGTEDRTGLEVQLKGYIKNDGTLQDRNYWEHVGDAGSMTGTNGFKKYTLSVAGQPFSQAIAGGFEMASAVTIPGPQLGWNGTAFTNLDTATGYALNGRTIDANFDVKVGGQKGQYHQVEQSANIGTIVWVVSVPVENTDAETAPDNPYLQ